MRIKTHIVHKGKTVIITKKIITLEINIVNSSRFVWSALAPLEWI